MAKRKVGRPTKYKPAYCQQLIAFMKAGGAKFSKPMTVSHGLQEGGEIVDHPIGTLPAFFEDFAEKLRVTMSTLQEWQRVHPEFSAAWKRAKAIQLRQMTAGGLSGTYQQASLIFALKNMHGWRDQTEMKHSGAVEFGPLVTLPAAEGMGVETNGHPTAHR